MLYYHWCNAPTVITKLLNGIVNWYIIDVMVYDTRTTGMYGLLMSLGFDTLGGG